jgi:hypothetical protein
MQQAKGSSVPIVLSRDKREESNKVGKFGLCPVRGTPNQAGKAETGRIAGLVKLADRLRLPCRLLAQSTIPSNTEYRTFYYYTIIYCDKLPASY